MILKPDVLQNAYNFAIDKVKKEEKLKKEREERKEKHVRRENHVKRKENHVRKEAKDPWCLEKKNICLLGNQRMNT